jgi:hypothetical protein
LGPEERVTPASPEVEAAKGGLVEGGLDHQITVGEEGLGIFGTNPSPFLPQPIELSQGIVGGELQDLGFGEPGLDQLGEQAARSKEVSLRSREPAISPFWP